MLPQGLDHPGAARATPAARPDAAEGRQQMRLSWWTHLSGLQRPGETWLRPLERQVWNPRGRAIPGGVGESEVVATSGEALWTLENGVLRRWRDDLGPWRGRKLAAFARGLIVQAKRNRRLIPRRQLAVFAGLAQSVYLAVPMSQLYLRAFHDCVATSTLTRIVEARSGGWSRDRRSQRISSVPSSVVFRRVLPTAALRNRRLVLPAGANAQSHQPT